MLTDKKKKTRHLPLCEYLKRLQLEYIVAELRRKIYPIQNDKDYYERLMKQKKASIEDISQRNYLPNIFTDNHLKKELYNEIYPEFGFPQMIYRDEEHRCKYEPLDKKYYYFQGSEFRVLIDNEIKIAIIKTVDFVKKTALLYINKKEIEINLDKIARIL